MRSTGQCLSSVLCLLLCGLITAACRGREQEDGTDASAGTDAGEAASRFYTEEGYAAELLYPMKPDMLDYAGAYFREIYDTFLDGNCGDIYLSVIPDKNYFLAERYGHPCMDYDAFVSFLREKTEYMTYIDLFPVLHIEDYYRTDLHWRQEALLPAARVLASAMGVTLTADYTEHTYPVPFAGRYSREVQPTPEPDALVYLTSPWQDFCIVTDYPAGEPVPGTFYDIGKAEGDDPYALFLSGNLPVQHIENPAAPAENRLVVFRDSFASAFVPLLAEGYREVTLIDLRYVRTSVLDDYVSFDGQDVLFLYSTHLLNNAKIMR